MYTEAFRNDIRETVLNHKVSAGVWYDPNLSCGCPLAELAIRKYGVLGRYNYGSAYMVALQNAGYSFNMLAEFVREFDEASRQYTTLTPIEIVNLIFRREDERTSTP